MMPSMLSHTPACWQGLQSCSRKLMVPSSLIARAPDLELSPNTCAERAATALHRQLFGVPLQRVSWAVAGETEQIS